MTHQQAWEAMSNVLFHREPVSTGVSGSVLVEDAAAREGGHATLCF